MEKVIQWFLLNMKTLRHDDLRKADPNWLNSQRDKVEKRSRDLRDLSPKRPDPRIFLKKGRMIETHRIESMQYEEDDLVRASQGSTSFLPKIA